MPAPSNLKPLVSQRKSTLLGPRVCCLVISCAGLNGISGVAGCFGFRVGVGIRIQELA